LRLKRGFTLIDEIVFFVATARFSARIAKRNAFARFDEPEAVVVDHAVDAVALLDAYVAGALARNTLLRCSCMDFSALETTVEERIGAKINPFWLGVEVR
jgi:hypothetical protein